MDGKFPIAHKQLVTIFLDFELELEGKQYLKHHKQTLNALLH